VVRPKNNGGLGTPNLLIGYILLRAITQCNTQKQVIDSYTTTQNHHNSLSTKSFPVKACLHPPNSCAIKANLVCYVTPFNSGNRLHSVRNGETMETTPTLSHLAPVMETWMTRHLILRVLSLPPAKGRRASVGGAATRILSMDNSLGPHMSTPRRAGVLRHPAKILLA
jgi:hypothetical protein